MLTWRNDPLILSGEITIKSLIEEKKRDLIFLDKNRKVLNLFSAFVKIEDFIRNGGKYQILHRFPYMKLPENFLEELLDNLDSKYHKNNFYFLRKEFSHYYGSSYILKPSSLNRWIKKSSPNLIFLRFLAHLMLDMTRNETDILGKIISQILYVTNCQNRSKFKPPILMRDFLSDKEIYLVGLAMGDGGFIDKNHWTLTDGNTVEPEKSRIFLVKVQKLLKDVYTLDSSVRNWDWKYGKKYILYVQNLWFSRYLNFFFDLPLGVKTEKLTKPPAFQLKPTNIALFWRGIFDTDGSVRKDTKTISLGMIQPSLINQCYHDLRRMGMSMSSLIEYKNAQHINIFTRDIDKFAKKIGFSHPRKMELLLSHLKERPRFKVFLRIDTHLINHGWFKLLEMGNLRVFGGDIIKRFRTNLGMSQRKLARMFRVSFQTANNWERNITAIPLEKLFELAKLTGVNEIEFYKKFAEKAYEFSVGVTGSKRQRLPSKIEEISRFIEHLLPVEGKVYFRNRYLNPEEFNRLKKESETRLGVEFKHLSSNEWVIYNTTLSKFLSTFFHYGFDWNFNDEEVEEMRLKLNRIWS